jgi:hypothetical protein
MTLFFNQETMCRKALAGNAFGVTLFFVPARVPDDAEP